MPEHIPGFPCDLDSTESVYVETRHYLKQIDGDRWIEVAADFFIEDGEMKGYVTEVLLYTERPKFDESKIIYRWPVH